MLLNNCIFIRLSIRYKQPIQTSVILNENHINFEKKFIELVGLTLDSVEYAEIIYDSENPMPFYNTEFDLIHSIDFSISLYTSSGERVEIYWDDTFFQYGIGMRINEKSNLTQFQKWNVTDTNVWQDHIGEKITDVKLYWETIISDDEEIVYPQSLKISFTNDKKMFISAAQFLDNSDKVFGISDNLVVTNNEFLAKHIDIIH